MVGYGRVVIGDVSPDGPAPAGPAHPRRPRPLARSRDFAGLTGPKFSQTFMRLARENFDHPVERDLRFVREAIPPFGIAGSPRSQL